MLYKKDYHGVIVAAEDFRLFDYDTATRRPYYRLRGRPVMPEQAMDIIRRTDRYLKDIEAIEEHPDTVDSDHFDTWMFDPQHYPMYYSWIHVDGTVGLDGITYKYPEANELIWDWVKKVKAFPYLDLVAAITNWNEAPNEIWLEGFSKMIPIHEETWDENFCEAVEMGIYVHDGMIELLGRERTMWKYEEYRQLYGAGDRRKYLPEYYQDYEKPPVDKEYLKNCIRAYGLEPELVKSRWSDEPLDLDDWDARRKKWE